MIRGPNQANAKFNSRRTRRPTRKVTGSWQISPEQRAGIENAANQVANAMRRPETLNALRQMAARFRNAR